MFSSKIKTIVTGVEMFHKEVDRGEAGDNLGTPNVLVYFNDSRYFVAWCQARRYAPRHGFGRSWIHQRPQEIQGPTLRPYQGRRYKTQIIYQFIEFLGGRHTPFVSNYRPQLFTRTADVTCVINLPQKDAMVMPGDNVAVEVELLSDVPIENGSRFTIREGGKTVGTGVVTEITE